MPPFWNSLSQYNYLECVQFQFFIGPILFAASFYTTLVSFKKGNYHLQLYTGSRDTKLLKCLFVGNVQKCCFNTNVWMKAGSFSQLLKYSLFQNTILYLVYKIDPCCRNLSKLSSGHLKCVSRLSVKSRY